MSRRWHLSLVLVCAVLGLLLATAFNTQEKARRLSQTPRKQELISKIRALEKEREKERDSIEKVRSSLAQYETKAAASAGNLQAFTKNLDALKFQAGLTKVKGPGLKITIADNPQPQPGDPNNYIIHDYDVRQVVNALWNGGAEAMSINGKRLVASTAIRCAGNTILVNSNRLASPYIIEAVGDAGKLEEALKKQKESSTFFDEIAKTFGLVTIVERQGSMTLPAYEGSIFFTESKVVGGVR